MTLKISEKIIELIENTALREELLQKSKNNIEEFSIQNRVEKLKLVLKLLKFLF